MGPGAPVATGRPSPVPGARLAAALRSGGKRRVTPTSRQNVPDQPSVPLAIPARYPFRCTA
jgi:hypothetical protein